MSTVSKSDSLDTRQRVIYANWYMWALSTTSGDSKHCHAAAQAAVRAFKQGGDAQLAERAALTAGSDKAQLKVVADWDEEERKYAEWYAWAMRSEGADPESGHRAAAAAMGALQGGKDQAHAADAGREFLLEGEEARLVRVAKLLDFLQKGGRLRPVENGSFHYHPGEYIAASVQANRLEFYGTEESHSSGWFVAFGNPILTIATLAGSVVVSAASKAAAQRRAAERWRIVDSGVLHVTNLRLAFQGSSEWFDIPYEYIRASGCFMDSVEIALDGRVPLRFQTPDAEWCFVAMRHLSGQTVAVELTPELREKAVRIGVL